MGTEDWDWRTPDRPDWERVLVGLRDCVFLGPEEDVHRRGLVSLNVGWLARGGLLRLHSDGLSFEPNPLERLLGARRRRFSFAELERVERLPARAGEILPGGQAARIRLHLVDGRSADLLPAGATLDDWLAALRDRRAIWRRRERMRQDTAETARRAPRDAEEARPRPLPATRSPRRRPAAWASPRRPPWPR